MKKEELVIIGARENNLKNVSLTIPKNKFVVFTGVSGSGKSSLAFNTIYEEGNRRYVNSLSSYARMFLGNSKKPDVDKIDGLSPAISIEQKTVHNNPRSTVGTITEIYDYLRLLFARIGYAFCPNHNIEISSQTNTDILNTIYKLGEGTKITVYAPIVEAQKGTFKHLFEKLQKEGFIRVKVDGKIYTLDDIVELDKNIKHDIWLVIGRYTVNEESYNTIAESVDVAAKEAEGLVYIEEKDTDKLYKFSKSHACIYKDFSLGKIETRLFSFNSPQGVCEKCKGIGVESKVDFDLLAPEKWRSINEGGIIYFENMVGSNALEWQKFNALLIHYGIDKDTPIENLSEQELHYIKFGSDEPIEYVLLSNDSSHMIRKSEYIEGIVTRIERMYFETDSERRRDYYKKYIGFVTCSMCNGSRLNKEALSVKINGLNIYDFTKLSIDDEIETLNTIISTLSETELEISRLILKELSDRLSFLQDVGLGYLNLTRTAETLSGGEAQRIRLATQIGSNLSGVLYVLDEPSIGLHQKDNEKLIATLRKMVDLGNTLIVVEHDEDTMYAADHIVDIGPKAGAHGGEVVANGSLEDICNAPNSITGKYLSGEWEIPTPINRRKGNGNKVTIKGAKENNLKNINVDIPLGMFVAVTGVSGSGKSTLINEIFVNGTQSMLGIVENHAKKRADFHSIANLNFIDKIVPVSQSPIGRTPRSNPATYIGVFDDIRDIFANISESKARGYTKSRFSFNVPGGRCEKCNGDGYFKIEMHFLPDVYVACDQCDGKRYNRETLEIKFKGKNIFEVLEMTGEEALEFFENKSKIVEKLQILNDVGLGYIHLGQMSTTLSGGEAQRIKLATYLQKKPTGRTVYVLDEPTTGLHIHDVKKLLDIINRIVDGGDTVVVIEHNLDVIKNADYIIDLGPDGGINGGKVVVTGTPEAVVDSNKGYTSQFLGKVLKHK
ncbi:excinuclease ABC subunit UvrA [Mycoplasma corogypsi]|uniref:excinuclease ABC subunit UvrA n=1 Tax=Mycoplasma corogypsi TaxID=2106 RepID=UPI0038736CEF